MKRFWNALHLPVLALCPFTAGLKLFPDRRNLYIAELQIYSSSCAWVSKDDPRSAGLDYMVMWAV
jgi:hypothetical protein